jgi:hypothetical protein
MAYSPAELNQFQPEFAIKSKHQTVVTAIMIILACAYAFEHVRMIGRIFGIPGEVFLVVFLILLIPAYINGSCPACKRMFGRRGELNPSHCKYCGIPLREV